MVFVLYVAGKITGIAALILGIFAIIFLVTSFTGVCPVYSWFGISTMKRDTHDEGHHGATPKAAH